MPDSVLAKILEACPFIESVDVSAPPTDSGSYDQFESLKTILSQRTSLYDFAYCGFPSPLPDLLPRWSLLGSLSLRGIDFTSGVFSRAPTYSLHSFSVRQCRLSLETLRVVLGSTLASSSLVNLTIDHAINASPKEIVNLFSSTASRLRSLHLLRCIDLADMFVPLCGSLLYLGLDYTTRDSHATLLSASGRLRELYLADEEAFNTSELVDVLERRTWPKIEFIELKYVKNSNVRLRELRQLCAERRIVLQVRML
jgi:hypothetical protein